MAERQYDWAAIAKNPKFVELHHKKQLFLFGWWIFSTVYYFLLPIGAAYTPGLFKIKIDRRSQFRLRIRPLPVLRFLGNRDLLCPRRQQRLRPPHP